MAAFFMSRFEEITLLLLRVVAGLMLMQHGAQKMFGVLGGQQPPTFSQGWFAGVIELVLPIFVVLGLGTRVAAFILAGEMAFAYFLGHASGGFWPVVNKGELAALYSFVFLYLSARGAGRYSIDAMLARRRGDTPDRRPTS